MKTNLTMPKISVLLSILVLLCSVNLYAQPANDDCATAVSLTIAADEASCTLTSATTVDGTPSTEPASVCSGSWFEDDVWFTVTTPAIVPDGALIIKAEFGNMGGDVLAVGMAFYEGCGAGALPLACFSNGDGALDEIKIFSSNLQPNTAYTVRVWSGGSPSDNSGSFRICSFWEPPSNDVVIWGANPGEGDFSTGFIDTTNTVWTYQSLSGDTSVWRYKACSCSNGNFRSGTVSSPTSFNGAAVFDADSMNTTMWGPPPGPPYPALTGELISPTIDASGFEAVSLKFYHAYAPLNGDAFFAYSLDDGATWSDNIEVSPELAGNALSPVPDEQRFFLPELAGQSTIKIKFTFSGGFYYWIIDDVQLIEPENNNLVVMENFYAIAPSAMTPVSQAEEFSFLADVANIGAAEQPNTVLTMTITDENTSATVYTEELAYGTLAADSLYENEPFPGCYLPDGPAGTLYTGVYSIASDSVDFDPTNNSRSFQFMLTDSTFAREFGVTRSVQPADGNWDATTAEPHSWAYGNAYHIVKGTDSALPEDQWFARDISFGIGNAAERVGELLSIYLYHWTVDTNEDGNMDSDERTPVALVVYEITGFETADEAGMITVALNPFGSNTPELIPLISGETYVAMVEFQTSAEENLSLLGAEPFDHSAQIFRTDPVEFGDKPFRPAEMLGIGGDLTGVAYSSAGFTGSVVPAVRLTLGQPGEVNVDELDAENLISVSPNPASDFINLSIDMVNTQPTVQVRILDATGKEILNRMHDNVSKETFNYNISDFAAGAYFLNFITEEGSRTERFIIHR